MPMLRKLQACESEILKHLTSVTASMRSYIIISWCQYCTRIPWPECVIVDEVILRSRCDAGFRSSSKKRREFQILLTWTSLVVIFRLLLEELENLASLARLSLSRMFKWQDRDQEFDENLNFFPKLIWNESIILLTTTRRESSKQKQKSWNNFWFAKAYYIIFYWIDCWRVFLLFLSFLYSPDIHEHQSSHFREHGKGKNCDDNLEEENVMEDFDDNAGNHDGGNFGAKWFWLWWSWWCLWKERGGSWIRVAVTQSPPRTLWPVNGIAPDGDNDEDFDNDGWDERIICGDHT